MSHKREPQSDATRDGMPTPPLMQITARQVRDLQS